MAIVRACTMAVVNSYCEGRTQRPEVSLGGGTAHARICDPRFCAEARRRSYDFGLASMCSTRKHCSGSISVHTHRAMARLRQDPVPIVRSLGSCLRFVLYSFDGGVLQQSVFGLANPHKSYCTNGSSHAFNQAANHASVSHLMLSRYGYPIYSVYTHGWDG